MTSTYTSQAPPTLTRDQFGERFHESFFDPAFDAERESLRRIETIAWEAARTGGSKRPASKATARPEPDRLGFQASHPALQGLGKA